MAMTFSLALLLPDAAILPTALPTIQSELSGSWVLSQWIISAYFLTMVGMGVACGRISDLIGNKKAYIIGISTFLGGSILCSFSYSVYMLIAARAVQGIGAGFIWPASMSIMIDTFPLTERGRALGISSAITSIILTLAPFFAGLVTQYFSWRWLFWVNIPSCAVCIWLASENVPRKKRPKERFDFLGFFSLFIGTLSTIVGFLLMREKVYGDFSFTVLFPLGFICLFFVFHTSQRAKDPFVDLTIFRNKLFVGGTAIATCANFVVVAIIYWNFFMQKSMLFTPLKTGLVMVFFSAPSLVFSPLAGYLSDRLGPKLPTFLGFICILLSITMAWAFTLTEFFPAFVLAIFLFGTGQALFLTPTAVSALSELSHKQRGIAYATYNSIRYLGTIVGISVLGSLNHWIRMSEFANFLARDPTLAHLEPKMAASVFNWAKTQFSTLPKEVLDYLRENYLLSSFTALNIMNFVAGIIAFIALILTFNYLKPYNAETLEGDVNDESADTGSGNLGPERKLEAPKLLRRNCH